jgi:glycosidase
VFYEAFVRSFSDSNGDGIGDLPGLTAKLDYINDGDPTTSSDLGVTGLWLMPTFPSPSYHGYDVTDYRAVNPDYGTLDDLRGLVKAAHDRGVAVILDMPFNHTSDQHPWFLDSQQPGSEHADWYVWADAPQGNGWHRSGDRFYYGAFGPSLPDLNLRNADVTAELTSVAAFWLDSVGVDGFRLDAAKHLIEDGPVTENTPETHAWWHDLRDTLRQSTAGPLLVGEVWDTPQISSSYVPDDLDMTFDFGLASVYVSAAGTGDGQTLGRVLTRITGLYPPMGFGAFLTNHDMDRVASQLGGDAARLRLAAGLLLTGPGVPFVYYGEEIGMTGQKPDERIRTPMRWDASGPGAGFSTHAPWEELSPDPASVNVADESGDSGSLLSWYRQLIALRSAHEALSTGTYSTVTASDRSVTAELRTAPQESLLVLANLSPSAVSGPSLRLESSVLCGSPSARMVLGDGVPAAPALTSSGGFSDYRPLESLPGSSLSVISLGR